MPKAIRNPELPTHRVSEGDTGKLGCTTYGAYGGGPTSTLSLLAVDVIEALAREGLSLEQAQKFLWAFGRVAQDFMLSGKVIAIPHMGMLFVQQQRTFLRTTELSQAMRKAGRTRLADKLAEKDRQMVLRNQVVFRTTLHLRNFFDDCGVPCGPWKHYVRAESTRLKARKRGLNPFAQRRPRRAAIAVGGEAS